MPDTTTDQTASATPDNQVPGSSSPQCKRVLGMISHVAEWHHELCVRVEAAFGPIDYRGPFLPFEDGGYYAAEMGRPLWRGWLSFRELANPADLAGWKRSTRELESLYRRNGRRSLNLDIGYMDPDKLVLASEKSGPFKLYLGGGVWADMILGYSGGAFSPMPWAFPDFRDGRYDQCLGVIRQKLKAGMRR